MNRVSFCLVVLLTLFSPPAWAEEPDLSGVWTLTSMTVFEGGTSQKMDLELFGEKLDARFEVKRTKAGYSAVPIQVSGTKGCESINLKIEKSGKNFIGEISSASPRKPLPDSSNKMKALLNSSNIKALLQISPAEVRAVFNPESPMTAPLNFETPTDKKEVRIDLTFRRAEAEVIVWVKGPPGATVSLGDWSEALKDTPLGIRTQDLPTDRETPFDVSLQISVDGQTTRDRIRIWAVGGHGSDSGFL